MKCVMRLLAFILLLAAAVTFAGCSAPAPGTSQYYYEIAGIEVYRDWYDFGLVGTGVNPKLDLTGLTVTKISGSASESKYPQDESEANARITLSETNTVWLIRIERGTSKSLRLITNKLTETGGTFTFVAEGKDTDVLGNEMGTWHISDKQQVSYTVHESSVSLVSLKDERSFIDRLLNNYDVYLSKEVREGTQTTRWLNSKLSELEKENNTLSDFLKAYDGAVIAIVVKDGDDVVYRKIYRVKNGYLTETTDKPDVIVVLEESDLQEIKEKFEVYDKNGWTSEEITKMKLLILSKIQFQGNLTPR